jgi:hypothetical protein
MTITITKENFAEVMLQIAEMLKEKEVLEFEEVEPVIELVKVDYDDVPEKVKKRCKEVEMEYKKN